MCLVLTCIVIRTVYFISKFVYIPIMSCLMECRKINDKQFPLLFKFGTIPACNLTTDKYLSLENWSCMFDQLDEILKRGNNSSTRNSFNLENGRLEVKTKWIKTTDTASMGSQILKILNLRSSTVGKYYLKIDVKLHSNFDQLIKQLQLQNRVPADTFKCEKDELNTQETPLVKHENSSEVVVISSQVEETTNNSSKLSKYTSDEIEEAYDILDINSTVEEYIPTPSAATAIENVPTYQPEKNSVQIEINQMQSQYSPTYVNADKDTSSETALYRPSTRATLKTPVNRELKKSHFKKHKSRRLSVDLFGSSDDENACGGVSSSSHTQHKVKRKKSSSPKKFTKSSKDSERTKKKAEVPDSQKGDRKSLTKIGDITIRNLMKESVPDILATYSEHQQNLSELFSKHLKRPKVHYKPKDIPPLVIQDILTSEQQSAMISFLEDNLVSKFVPDPNVTNCSDILFDAIFPEWAFEMFCRKFDFTRKEALERLHLQATASLDNQSDSEFM